MFLPSLLFSGALQGFGINGPMDRVQRSGLAPPVKPEKLTFFPVGTAVTALLCRSRSFDARVESSISSHIEREIMTPWQLVFYRYIGYTAVYSSPDLVRCGSYNSR
jgi:hypothetical protein